MEKADLLSLAVHNERFENYEALSREEKLLMLYETSQAVDHYMSSLKTIENLDTLKEYMKKMPDVHLILRDIEERRRVLDEE